MTDDKVNERKHGQDDPTTKTLTLKEDDRKLIADALCFYAEEKEDKEEWKEYIEELADYVR